MATGLVAEILEEMSGLVDEVSVVPGAGGVFDVEVDGDLVFSKGAAGRFPEEGEIPKALAARTD